MATLNHLTAYCRAVIDGKLIACQKHQWACLRFINDLNRRGKEGWQWDFDEVRAERYFYWMRQFKHRKGELAGQAKEPCDYEMFVYGNVYGWIDSKTESRRFRRMYEQLARKQAKSQDKAIQALYEMSAFGEPSAEVYVAATQKSQTRYVWDEAGWLIKNSILEPHFTVKHDAALLQKVIKHNKSGSIFARLSKEEKKTGDGANPHFGILDEYHLHDTAQYYDLLTSGMKTRRNPLLSIITTAGFELNNPCFRVEYDFVSRLLNPNDPTQDDRYFAIVCELDRNETPDIITAVDGRKIEPGGIIDEVGSEAAILKSNPVTGMSPVVRESIEQEIRDAINKPEKMRDVLTKTFNVWVQNRPQGYMDMTRWANCKVTAGELMDIIATQAQGRCYIGLDLSAKLDLTSVGFVFPYDDGGVQKHALYSHSFIPDEKYHEKIHQTDRMPYDVWRRNGYLTVTDGAVVDYQKVLQYIADTCVENAWSPAEFCLDPWGSTAISTQLQNDGHKVVEIIQGIKTLAEPTKTFRELVYSRRVVHDDNPVLTWAVGNAVTRSDHNNNIMLDKSKARQRIDPIAAIITAFTRAMVVETESEVVSWGVMFV